MFSGDTRWHTNCIKHTIFHPRGNLKTAVWVNCWKSVTSWSSSTPCMDYWTLIRGLLMEARTAISPHSFPVTHAEIKLVSSQTITINSDCTCWQHPAGEWQTFLYIFLCRNPQRVSENYHSWHCLKTVYIKWVHEGLKWLSCVIKKMTADDSMKEKDRPVPDTQHTNIFSGFCELIMHLVYVGGKKNDNVLKLMVTSWNSLFCLTDCSKSKLHSWDAETRDCLFGVFARLITCSRSSVNQLIDLLTSYFTCSCVCVGVVSCSILFC